MHRSSHAGLRLTMGLFIDKTMVADVATVQVVSTKRKGKTMSLVQQIMSAEDRPKMKIVQVPEWGVDVGIVVMAAKDKGIFEANQVGVDGKVTIADIKQQMLARCLCDPATGELLFSSGSGGAESLGSRSSIVIDRLALIAQELNQIGVEAVEEMAKNSVETAGVDS